MDVFAGRWATAEAAAASPTVILVKRMFGYQQGSLVSTELTCVMSVPEWSEVHEIKTTRHGTIRYMYAGRSQ